MGLFDRFAKNKKQEAAPTQATCPTSEHPVINALAKKLYENKIPVDTAVKDGWNLIAALPGPNNKIPVIITASCKELDQSGVAIKACIQVKEINQTMLRLANQYSQQYRYLKFYNDVNGKTFCANYTIPECVDNPVEVAYEMFLRSYNIFNAAVEEFLNTRM